MELRCDHDQWASTPPAPRKGEEAPCHLDHGDWQALAARLAAGHALARTLTQEKAMPLSPVGSFDPAAARHMHLYAAAPAHRSTRFSPTGSAYRAVNPVASGDRKTMSGIPIGVAGPFLPAIEG